MRVYKFIVYLESNLNFPSPAQLKNLIIDVTKKLKYILVDQMYKFYFIVFD